jgi:hypothetical protein
MSFYSFIHYTSSLRLLAAPGWVTRPINRTLNMPSNAILTSVKLAPNHAVLAERSANSLRDLTNRSIRVELLSNGSSR